MNFPTQLHHAYVIEGNIRNSREALFAFLKSEFDVQPGNPDLFLFSTDAFTIEDARNLTDTMLRRALTVSGKGAGRKFIVVDFHSISGQAQNGLLKTLEEPIAGTHIFLITTSAFVFLPTILSRVHVLKDDSSDIDSSGVNSAGSNTKKVDTKEGNLKELAKKFLLSNQAKRLEMIKEIMVDKDKEKINDADIDSFISEIESIAHEYVTSKKGKTGVSIMKPFTVIDEYKRDTSASKKMLLEYVALLLPIF